MFRLCFGNITFTEIFSMKNIPTFHPEINHKINTDKTYSVFLRITLNRKMKRLPTGIFLKRSTDFNKNAAFGKWVRTSELLNKDHNDLLIGYADQIDHPVPIHFTDLLPI